MSGFTFPMCSGPRATGRTHNAIARLTPGDVFVAASAHAAREAERIARKTHGDDAGDLVIISLSHDPDSLRGRRGCVVLDHYAEQVLACNYYDPRAARWRHAIEMCNINAARRRA